MTSTPKYRSPTPLAGPRVLPPATSRTVSAAQAAAQRSPLIRCTAAAAVLRGNLVAINGARTLSAAVAAVPATADRTIPAVIHRVAGRTLAALSPLLRGAVRRQEVPVGGVLLQRRPRDSRVAAAFLAPTTTRLPAAIPSHQQVASVNGVHWTTITPTTPTIHQTAVWIAWGWIGGWSAAVGSAAEWIAWTGWWTAVAAAVVR